MDSFQPIFLEKRMLPNILLPTVYERKYKLSAQPVKVVYVGPNKKNLCTYWNWVPPCQEKRRSEFMFNFLFM